VRGIRLGSSDSELLDSFLNIMKDNQRFLHENAKDTYVEVMKLVDDTIDYVMKTVKDSKWKEKYVKFSMLNFIHHILMPLSYAIYMDFLSANMVACFFELRLMLESLVKSYWADLKYPEQTFFQEKMRSLEEEGKSVSKWMKESGENFASLWGKLSQRWVHTKGIVDRIVNEIAQKSEIPAWALAVPMIYTEADIDTIVELRERISQFRVLLKDTIDKWEERMGITTH